MRSVGVEEELLLVDARSGEPLALSGALLEAADRFVERQPDGGGESQGHTFEKELQEEQLEFATKPVTEMGELLKEITRWRGKPPGTPRPPGRSSRPSVPPRCRSSPH